MILCRCYAKVNLTLEVLGRRPDGYQELASLAHTVNLADDLRIEEAEEILCRAEGLEPLVEPQANLVLQAAELLREWTRVRAGADLTVLKRIPVAAGLGGGSSDAAATLVCLNSLWGTQLRYRQLLDLAAQLGSDVPFFVRGGAAILGGSGTEVTPVRPLVGQWLTLAVLPHDVRDKTASLYAALERADYTDGQATRDAAARLNARAPLPVSNLNNAFSRVAEGVFPGLEAAWRAAEAACDRRFHLSGAGPALFTLAASRDHARRLVPALEHLGLSAFATRTVGHARASVQVAGADTIGYP